MFISVTSSSFPPIISSVGVCTWLLDHDPVSLRLISRSFDGVPEGLSPDDILDNITHYWLTNTGLFRNKERYLLNVSLARTHIDDKHIVAPYNISSGLFGIRHSYSDNYYATDRGCSARDGNMALNAIKLLPS
jgi:hypothetical protein